LAIVQNGNVTPGHAVTWVTTGVVGDGGATPASQRVLSSLRGANFNTTFDQPIPIPQNIVAFQLTSIIVTNVNISMNAAQGGFYPQASKGGTAIVAAGQSYAALTSSSVILNPTLAGTAGATRFSALNLGLIGNLMQIWFSLSMGQGQPGVADIYLLGIDLT
jgi:hypothetical protein